MSMSDVGQSRRCTFPGRHCTLAPTKLHAGRRKLGAGNSKGVPSSVCLAQVSITGNTRWFYICRLHYTNRSIYTHTLHSGGVCSARWQIFMTTPVNMQGFFQLFAPSPFTLQNEGNWGRSRRCPVLIFRIRIAYFQTPVIAASALLPLLPLSLESFPGHLWWRFPSTRTSATALAACLLWGVRSAYLQS